MNTDLKTFKIKEVDREFYDKRLRRWLPEKIIDIHTHVWLKQFNESKKEAVAAQPSRWMSGAGTTTSRHLRPEVRPSPIKLAKAWNGISDRTVSWPAMVADENPVEHLIETYRLMFPGKTVTPLMFTNLVPEKKMDKANDYVAQISRERKFPALIFSLPCWKASEFEDKIKAGGFCGAKSYLSYASACLPAAEIRIFDFFPQHQLEVLNKHGWIMMLHIPRNARLRDPVNLAQMLEIERRYPDIKLIIAHVGRAYCPEDIGNAFRVLSKTKKMCFDISANTNAEAFRRLLETVGPKRVLFGSDMPITRMRMRRICENGKYINLVPKGMYGDVSGDSHMREVAGQEAAHLTFFMYEELFAFSRVAHAVGLTAGDIEDVFYNNADGLLKK